MRGKLVNRTKEIPLMLFQNMLVHILFNYPVSIQPHVTKEKVLGSVWFAPFDGEE